MTEQEIESLAHRMAWRYSKSHDPHHSDTYTFNRQCLLQFADGLLAAERERYLSLIQATEDILEDGHMNTEYLARLRSGYLFVMDGPDTQPQVNSDGEPHWSPADEAMFWLNEVERFQGGGNGPTIKLRAAILAITQPPATGK